MAVTAPKASLDVKELDFSEVRESQDHQRLLVLFIGGQMGLKPDVHGVLTPCPGYLTEQVNALISLHDKSKLPEVVVKEFDNLEDSCDVSADNWLTVAKEIQEHYLAFDGFVVIMGTDTMAYSASALSFMLENLGKTVIFTGAQIPFSESYSDAKRNLLVSISMACALDISEVCIFFDDKLFRANRCRKADSGSFDAFSSPNFPPLATLGLTMQVNNALLLPPPKGRFRIHTRMDTRMVVLKLVPCFDMSALLRLTLDGADTCRAIVLELYGTGNAPQHHTKFMQVSTKFMHGRALTVAKEKGTVVVVTSQCASGSVIPGTYAVNKELDNIGVVPALDMTTEATCAKLAYLFGKGMTPDQVARALHTSLRGEISPNPLSMSNVGTLQSQPTSRL